MEKCPQKSKVNEIIEELYATNFVQNYVKKRLIGVDYQEDVAQDIFEMLLIWPRLEEIYNQKGINGVRAIASGMIQRSISTKGALYRRYTREQEWLRYQGEIDDEKPDFETV